MSRQLEAALVLRARDEASRPLLRALQQVDRQAGAAGQAIGQAGKAGAGRTGKDGHRRQRGRTRRGGPVA